MYDNSNFQVCLGGWFQRLFCLAQKLGKFDPIWLAHMFQMGGWNHQLEKGADVFKELKKKNLAGGGPLFYCD